MRTLTLPDDIAAGLSRWLGGGGDQYGYKHDIGGTSATFATSGFMHGPGGLLTYPGVGPDFYSTIVGLRGGLMAQLPAVPTNDINPIFGLVTGVTGDSGSEPVSGCVTPPTGGLMKICRQTIAFGHYARATDEINALRLGARINRADPVDLRFVNPPQGTDSSPFNPPTGGGDILNNEMDQRFFTRAVSLNRLLRRQLITGNPANNLGDPLYGAYAEFPGLDLLISTGHVDAVDNTSCPTVDSDVKDFQCLDVASNGGALVDALTYLVRNTTRLASQTGLDPVRFALVMRETLFYEITKVWPCSMLTYACTPTGTNQNLNMDAGDIISMRDAMRTGSFLWIDGQRVEVIQDESIPEDTQANNALVPGPNCVCSDIYLVPFSVLGRKAVTYLEYFDWNNPSLNSLRAAMPNALIEVEGPWIETMRQTGFCTVFEARITTRLVLETPQLAGRLNNVGYCPLQHGRDPLPDDPYYVNGGVTGDGWVGGGSLYANWRT